jgi:hypothetical protein
VAALRISPLGGCPLANPMIRLRKRGVAISIFNELGFRSTPLSLSAGGALQLVRMCRGEFRIPEIVRDICYKLPPAGMPPRAAEALSTADLVLVEMSTPMEICYRDYIFSQNRLREYLVRELREMGEAAVKTATKWESALKKGDNGRARYLSEKLNDILAREKHGALLEDIINNTTSRVLCGDAIHEGINEIRKLLPLPFGIVLHNFHYMPDGRPVVWPQGFKDDTISAAERLGIPTYDPAPLVQKAGTAVALADDLRHYSPFLYEQLADEFLRFFHAILGRDPGADHRSGTTSQPHDLEPIAETLE